MENKLTLRLHICIFFLAIISIGISNFTFPRVVSVTFKSGNNERVNIVAQQVKIVFSRPMDQQSTANAFSINPTVRGNVSWADNSLYFTPLTPLRYDQTYTIKIVKSSKDIYKKNLSQSFRQTFHTKDASFAYIGNDKQLHVTDLKGNTKTLTQGKGVTDYQIKNDTIVYIQNSDGDTNKAYVYDDTTKRSKQLLTDEDVSYNQFNLARMEETFMYYRVLHLTRDLREMKLFPMTLIQISR